VISADLRLSGPSCVDTPQVEVREEGLEYNAAITTHDSGQNGLDVPQGVHKLTRRADAMR
jgi:hypothetical protein